MARARLFLTDAQKEQLVIRALKWTATIERIKKPKELTIRSGVWPGNSPEMEALGEHFAEMDANIHLLSIALEHLYNCVRLLTTAGVALSGARDFSKHWQAISDLRDAREHEEATIAGLTTAKPRHRSDDWIASGYFESGRLQWDDDGIEIIEFMGLEYKAKPAILAAFSMRPHLEALLNNVAG